MSDKTFISAEPRSRAWPIICACVFIAGLGIWLGYLTTWDPPRAWRALLINFIFFAPLAAGMVVWSSAVMIAQGRWMGSVERTALAGVGHAPVSILVFIVLAAGAWNWAPWLHQEPWQKVWLNYSSVFLRDGVGLLVFWVLAAWYASLRKKGQRPTVLAGWLTLVYCIVFTLIGFDMVMALDPKWYSTLFGAYYFVSGMYCAVAALTLAAVVQRRPLDRGRMHDLGKLIVAFSLVTTYLMYSQLLPIWFNNFPQEVRFVVPRLHGPQWQFISVGLLAVIYLGPLVILLTVWSKRSPVYLGIVAALVLVGMWVERWWLVTPTLGGELTIGAVEISITAALAAALGLGLDRLKGPLAPLDASDLSGMK